MLSVKHLIFITTLVDKFVCLPVQLVTSATGLTVILVITAIDEALA